MTYQNSNKTNVTSTEKGDLEKEVESIGIEIDKLTGRGKRAEALELYQKQTSEIQKEIKRKYPYAIKSTQLCGI